MPNTLHHPWMDDQKDEHLEPGNSSRAVHTIFRLNVPLVSEMHYGKCRNRVFLVLDSYQGLRQDISAFTVYTFKVFTSSFHLKFIWIMMNCIILHVSTCECSSTVCLLLPTRKQILYVCIPITATTFLFKLPNGSQQSLFDCVTITHAALHSCWLVWGSQRPTQRQQTKQTLSAKPSLTWQHQAGDAKSLVVYCIMTALMLTTCSKWK